LMVGFFLRIDETKNGVDWLKQKLFRKVWWAKSAFAIFV
jgi:hypothetical protein